MVGRVSKMELEVVPVRVLPREDTTALAVRNEAKTAVIAAAMASAACSGSIANTTADTPTATAAQTQIAPAPNRYATALPDFASLAEHTIPDAGHMLHHDQPERLAQTLEAFLSGRAADPR